MGILTDPNNHRRNAVSNFVIKFHSLLSWLCYLAGIVMFFMLPHPMYNNKTYFSENALLPGLVTGEFHEERAALRYYEDLKEENKRYPGEAPFPWLEAQFKQLGLDVYRQQFSLKYPLAANSTFRGSNVYAILRAPKSASTEAVVLSAPHRPPSSPHQSTNAGIAVLLAAAKHFRKQIYWAKDIIFLVTEHEFLGIQAWLEAYHGVSHGGGFIRPGALMGRAGSIQAAINLEIDTPDITHFNVKVEGLNGQLPNLDLVNLVNKLIIREGLHPMFKEVEDSSKPDSYRGYMRSLRTMVNMMTAQATGVPTGNHGLYHRFGIEAVTLEGIHKTGGRRPRPKADFVTLGRIVEGCYRSLNNLLERFHQSFFFYLLSSGSRYISIGLYMPMLGLLAVGFLLTALGLWFSLVGDSSNTDKKPFATDELLDMLGVKDSLGLLNSQGDGREGAMSSQNLVPVPAIVPPHFKQVLPVILICHSLGVLSYVMPGHAAHLGEIMGLGPEESVPLSLGALGVLIVFLPFCSRPHLSLPSGSWKVAKCLLCLELAAIIGCTGLCNISLATFTTLVYLPTTLLARPVSGWRSVPRLLLTVMCHPLLLSCCVTTLDTIRTFPGLSFYKLALRSLEAWQRGIMFSIVDSLIYGNVLYDLATLLLLPTWTMLYLINCSKEEEDPPKAENAGDGEATSELKKDL